jgi:hypothetical protein
MTIRQNRLADATSPYLLQHAENPVDWYPWTREAFERARLENKPVFLSIGYSTCHWCHVMAHESFEDPAVADLLNRYFVSIKVDKEERPDLNALYMTVAQQMTGRGGWPLTVILTPDKKPFYAGTYLPKTTRWGRPGMLQLLPAIHEAWESRQTRILETADQITREMAEAALVPPGRPLAGETLDRAEEELKARYDRANGGFGSAPKFPSPHQLGFLLRQYHRKGDPFLLEMVDTTLDRMRRGGIFDHVGLGFHRYSTDAQWRVPHFEKMLYDQALISMAYLEAWQVTGKELYRQTVRDILAYVLGSLRAPEGGFHTAEDADSEGAEGRFYQWTEAQLKDVLGPEDAQVFMAAYGITGAGSAVGPAAGNAHVLYQAQPLEGLARQMGLDESAMGQRMQRCLEKLHAARRERIRPFKDDKILTDWNGLMIAALARAGRVLEEPSFNLAAAEAAAFIHEALRDKDGHLLKSYRLGKAQGEGLLEDYAYLVWGLIELYGSFFDPLYLELATDLNECMLKRFQNPSTGGLAPAPRDGEKPLFEHHEIQDGALPSGNAVAVLNLLRLRDLTGKTDHGEAAERIMTAFSDLVFRSPWKHAHLMTALGLALNPGVQVVVVGGTDAPETKRMLSALEKPFLPEKAVVFKPTSGDEARIDRLIPRVTSMTALNDAPTAYICKDFTCKQPTSDIEEMLRDLGKKSLQKMSD